MPTRVARRGLAVTLRVLGVLTLLCSMVLAVGALLGAIGPDSGTGAGAVTRAVSAGCDVLVGPLGDLFDIADRAEQSRADLVTRGIASMIYLALGLGLPALAHRVDPRADRDAM